MTLFGKTTGLIFRHMPFIKWSNFIPLDIWHVSQNLWKLENLWKLSIIFIYLKIPNFLLQDCSVDFCRTDIQI